MAEIRVNATGGLKLYDADDSHYAQIVAGTITSNVDAITLGHDTVTIADNLSLGSDSSVLKFGADGDTTLTHTDGTGLTLNSTNKICFNDASQFIQGSSNAVLSLGATDEIDLTATAVDLNGTLNVSGVATFQSTPVFPDGSLAVDDLDIDGATDIGAAIVDADLFIIDDGAGGTHRKVTASRLKTYAGASGDITTIDSILNTDIKIGEDDQTKIDFETADTINFYTNNAVKMAIASTGATTIDAGDNNVTALTVTQKGGYNGIHIKGDSSNTGTVAMIVDASGSGDQYYKLQSDGAFKWQIKNDYSDSHRLWIADGSGDGVYMDQDATSWSSSSDERLKDNWTNFSNAETKINTLTKLGTHKRKVYDKVNNTVGAIKQDIDGNDIIDIGVSAQEIESIVPEAVTEDANGYKGVDYQALIPLLLKAVQELSVKVKTLEDA